MNDLIEKNNRLKLKIKKLRLTMRRLKREIASYRVEIDEYENGWMLLLFDSVNAILEKYSVLLNPPAIKLKTTYENQAASFDVELENIVFIQNQINTKKIFLKKEIASVGNIEYYTDVIYYRSTWAPLIEKLDRSHIYLCKAGESHYVNIKFFNLKGNCLLFNKESKYGLSSELSTEQISNSKPKRKRQFKLSPKEKANFIAKKEMYLKILASQKKFERHKVKTSGSI